jgi:hypothetical protein
VAESYSAMMNGRNNEVNDINISEKGGRRKDNSRRQFTYTFHLPERRSGVDRRANNDRRRENRYEEDD